MSPSGFVFNIQRFSLHDGPGIRTTVFLSGCPLRCFWCHNPEGLQRKPQVQFFADKCILCGECLQICQHSAHSINEDGNGRGHVYTRAECVRCGECIQACCAEALQFTGQEVGIEQVMIEIMADRKFYATSGGGVTLSGGDPLLQRPFSRAILQACKDSDIHTAIETSAFGHWADLEELLPWVDLLMMDIKHLDDEKHTWATGVSNQVILSNARKIADSGLPIIFRIPIIPTVNDTTAEIAAIAEFIQSLRETDISLELLPFHRLAGDKYASLDLQPPDSHLQTPSKAQMSDLLAVARQSIPHAIAR